MTNNIVPAPEHYDRMIDEIDDPAQPMITDPFYDTGWLRDWLEQSDGPPPRTPGRVCLRNRPNNRTGSP